MIIVVIVLFVFLLAPVLLVIPMSFSADATMGFPPSGWSTIWYGRLLADGAMMAAFRTSLLLGAATTILAIAIGLPASYALVRKSPPGGRMLYGLFTAPLLLPTIVLGLALLIVLAPAGLLGTFTGLLAAHLVMTLPYALRILATALATLPPQLAQAASMLGAGPFLCFRRITLPLLRPGLFAAAALCFLVSFDEVVASLFLTGPRLTTLPVQMFRHAESRADPMIAVISVLLVTATIVVVIAVDRSLGLARSFVPEKPG
jgi:putative spermidine/putrescine transport system permease protein